MSQHVPQLYTSQEAAVYLGCGRQWIDKLVADGRLVPVREKPRLFTLDALLAAARLVRQPGNPGKPVAEVGPPLPGYQFS